MDFLGLGLVIGFALRLYVVSYKGNENEMVDDDYERHVDEEEFPRV